MSEEVRVVERRRSPSQDVAVIGVVGGLYAALIVATGSFGIGPFSFRIAPFLPPVVGIVYDPIIAGIAAALGLVISDALLGWLAIWSIGGAAANFLKGYVPGVITRDINNVVQIVIGTTLAYIMAGAIIAGVLDMAGIVPFLVFYPMYLITRIPHIIVVPIIVRLAVKAGLHKYSGRWT